MRQRQRDIIVHATDQQANGRERIANYKYRALSETKGVPAIPQLRCDWDAPLLQVA